MGSGGLPVAPIWDDIKTLSGARAKAEGMPTPEIIYGGFPCQNISAAGRGEGLEGERSRLFFEVVRLVEEIRPAFVFLENVPAIRTRGLARVLSEFTALRYDCRWTIVSAAEVGAPHLRKRWFLLAHAHDERGRYQPRWRGREKHREISPVAGLDGAQKRVAHTAGKRSQRWLDPEAAWKTLPFGRGRGRGTWPRGIPKPTICRSAHGFPSRLDRLRGLGNAVVPLQARVAFERLMGLESN